MMSPENVDNPVPDKGPSPKPTSLRPPEQALRCPRCDSPNTKFCYYNNYSLTQPRHFCKTCRRYWTKGGALRNVPIGGGCRKSKKCKSAASRLLTDPKDVGATAASSDASPGFNFLHGLSPAMEFQLSGLPFSRLHSHTAGPFNQFFSFGDLSSSPSPTAPAAASTTASCFTLESAPNPSSLLGFNYPLTSIQKHGESSGFGGGIQEMGGTNLHSSIASSIESLSSINQDLHWKLQQQRLAMLYVGENQKENSLVENQQQQPISFQDAESSKVEALGGADSRKGCGGNDNTNEWFFGNSYNGNSNNNNSSSNHTSNWSEIQTWNDLHQYSALP